MTGAGRARNDDGMLGRLGGPAREQGFRGSEAAIACVDGVLLLQISRPGAHHDVEEASGYLPMLREMRGKIGGQAFKSRPVDAADERGL
ncbi:MAG: hypothetical protein EOP61_34405, partial [Sphingomonadales bacterium]